MSDLDLLQTVLAAEHRAVYGYGLAGARQSGTARQQSTALWQAHRTRRDRVVSLIRGRDGEPVAAEASYRLPDGAPAQLAVGLEEALLEAYLGLAGAADPALREFAARAMQEAMTRRVRWARTSPPSPFPGLPEGRRTPGPGAGP
ncbi:ferritin-like domain-containing protein [Actinocorallia populi]|uniref:ferritin-like domain-containing protein n=1 Tax=Actinocorallia populi TaxID=2079200 RepID=UPI000D093662|nr:ferritin-like domain-containing protein [Actinocorallia populi]